MLTRRTLNQILDVLGHLRKLYKSGRDLEKSYHLAVQRVSKKYDVSYQTIGDGCRRRLDLNSVVEFRQLVKQWIEGDLRDLKRVLKEKTEVSQHSRIDAFLGKVDILNSDVAEENQGDGKKQSLEVELSYKEIRYLNALSEIERKEVKDLLRVFIKEGVKSRMTKIADDLI